MIITAIHSLILFTASIIYTPTVANPFDKVTIVVLDGKAFLANVNDQGEVVFKYMELQGSIDLSQNLEGEVVRAREQYEKIRELEKDQIRFINYELVGSTIAEAANAHLRDLVNHYNNTYANQIVITLGKRQGNEEFLNEKENLLTEALLQMQVPKEDIIIVYKWDRGPEPTEFIKVQTSLRELPAL